MKQSIGYSHQTRLHVCVYTNVRAVTSMLLLTLHTLVAVRSQKVTHNAIRDEISIKVRNKMTKSE